MISLWGSNGDDVLAKVMGRPGAGAELDILGGCRREELPGLSLPPVDLYWSLNGFWKPKKPGKPGALTWMRGATKHLAALNALWVDLDYYRTEWHDKTREQFKQSVLDVLGPNMQPSIFAWSGRGAYIIYVLDPILHSEVGSFSFWQSARRWKAIAHKLTARLAEWGSDSAASISPSGVLRIPGSINAKSNSAVEYQILSDKQLNLETLESGCSQWGGFKRPVGRSLRADKGIQQKRPIPKGLKKGSVAGLNQARLQDLDAILQDRNSMGYNWEGIRNKFCFTWAQMRLQSAGPAAHASVDDLLALNDSFESANSRSAEEWEIRCITRTRAYTLKNSKIIADLAISEDEMRRLGLKTLISKGIKNERRRGAARGGIDGRRERSRGRDEAVLDAVSKGSDSVATVMAATGLSRPSVYRALGALGTLVVSISGRLAVGGEVGVGGFVEQPTEEKRVELPARTGEDSPKRKRREKRLDPVQLNAESLEVVVRGCEGRVLLCLGEDLVEGAWLVENQALRFFSAPDSLEVEGILADPQARVVGMDLKSWLKKLNLGHQAAADLFDLRVAASVLDARVAQWGWKRMASRFFDAVPDTESVAVWKLGTLFKDAIKEQGLQDVMAEEMRLALCLDRIERRGLGVDRLALEVSKASMLERMGAIEAKFARMVGGPVDLSNNRDVAELLFQKLELPVLKRTSKGRPSTDAGVLEELGHVDQAALLVTEFRKLYSAVFSCIEPLLVAANGGDRIHPSIHQGASINGRLSARNPNIQGVVSAGSIGNSVRSTFVAGEGKNLVGFDLSQIEVRALAHLSGDKDLIRFFWDGGDIYAMTAAKVKGVPVESVDSTLRTWAKEALIACIYGMGAKGLAAKLRASVEDAKNFIADFDAAFPGIKLWNESLLQQVRMDGFLVLPNGVRRYFDAILSTNWQERFEAERQAINAMVQGTAAIWFKKIALELDENESTHGLVNLVHDEGLMEVAAGGEDAAIEAIQQAISAASKELHVPLVAKVGTGRNWREVHLWMRRRG